MPAESRALAMLPALRILPAHCTMPPGAPGTQRQRQQPRNEAAAAATQSHAPDGVAPLFIQLPLRIRQQALSRLWQRRQIRHRLCRQRERQAGGPAQQKHRHEQRAAGDGQLEQHQEEGGQQGGGQDDHLQRGGPEREVGRRAMGGRSPQLHC